MRDAAPRSQKFTLRGLGLTLGRVTALSVAIARFRFTDVFLPLSIRHEL